MATLDENIEYWDRRYPWKDEGNEWSNLWGHPKVQWYGTILPRISAFLPAGNLLEIAPGYGRWTSFLAEHCTAMTAVDVSEKAVSCCRQKFAHLKHLQIHQNDGCSLPMIQPSSIDFLFSMDSFVHFDQKTIACYLKEISEKLKPGGIGFIHHSNLGLHCSYISNAGWRSPDVSHITFEEACREQGLYCFSQELVGWCHHQEVLTDCFSFFIRSEGYVRNHVVENHHFHAEVDMVRSLSGLIW